MENDINSVIKKPKKLLDWNILYLLAIISFVLISLFIKCIASKLDPFTQKYYGNKIYMEMNITCKFYMLIYCTCFILVICVLFHKELFKKQSLKLNQYLLLSGAFILFSFISAILSEYKEVSFMGIYYHREGFITFLCYFILFIYCIFSYKNSKDINILLGGIAVIVVVNFIIGINQYLGHDILRSSFGKTFIWGNLKDTIQNIDTFIVPKEVSGTFANSNYSGSFISLVLPLMIISIFGFKNKIFSIIMGFISLMGIIFLVLSNSQAGMVGFVASIIVAVVLFFRLIKAHYKVSIIVLLSGAVVFTSIIVYLNNKNPYYISSFKDDAKALFSISKSDYKAKSYIKDIKEKDGTITFVMSDNSITFKAENKHITCADKNGQPVKFDREATAFTTKNEALSNVSYSEVRTSVLSKYIYYLSVNIKDKWNGETLNCNLKINSNNTLSLLSPSKSQTTGYNEAPYCMFRGKEKIGSGRGYIWSRSIPMMKNSLFIGRGPDTMLFTFPNNDYLAKFYTFNKADITIAKPHNVYLQIFINHGGIAFLAYILIMIVYVVDCIKLYFLKKHYTYQQLAGIGICLGIIAYFAAGLFNDSMITTAPTFYVLLGTGIAINYNEHSKITE